MMRKGLLTFSGIAKKIYDMYALLLGPRELPVIETSNNFVGRRLRLLRQIVRGEITRGCLSIGEAVEFYEALLDAVALQHATGVKRGVFDPLEIGEPALLGKRKIRRSDLKVKDEPLADWHFARLVQAAACAQGFSSVKDLRYDSRFKNKQVCDFALQASNGLLELLECKRVHPVVQPKNNQTATAAKKVLARLAQTTNQLKNTASVLGASWAYKHALFDVSAYAVERREKQMKTGHLSVVGFSCEEINQIYQALISAQDKHLQVLDKITLCWRKVVFINKRPTAIIQDTSSYRFNTNIDGLLNYEGWTVEGYPKKSSEYAELRVSKTVRTLAWIQTTYNNLSSPETFSSIGPVEQRAP